MAEGKRCNTCQWFSDVGLCREPRNLGVRFMVGPGGENMVIMVPMQTVYSYTCDFWAKPKPANLRVAE